MATSPLTRMLIGFCLMAIIWAEPASSSDTTPAAPGSGLTPGVRLITADLILQRIEKIDRTGALLWSYDQVKPMDVWAMPDGNVLVAYLPSPLTANKGGLRLIDPDKQTVFDLPFADEIMSVQPLENGHYLIAECDAGQVTELDRQGKRFRSFDLKSKGMGHKCVRQIRLTPQGTMLTGEMYSNKVREYDLTGKLLKEFDLVSGYCPYRLANGNTLVAAWHPGKLVEFDPAGKAVWELAASELPAELNVTHIAESIRLENGNTLIAASCKPGGKPAPRAKLFEITPDKKVLWQIMDKESASWLVTVKPIPDAHWAGVLEADKRKLKLAIEDLTASFPGRYTRGAEFLKRLETVTDRKAFETLQREALIANPLLCGQPILFAVRNQYRSDHHNTETMFQTGELNTGSYQGGGAFKTIDFAKGGEVKTILDAGATGVARDPDISFDGRRILFSMRRNIQDNYHLYEIQADGSGLKQLTSAAGVFDIDPIYLPDGDVVFTSSREPKYCMCNRHIMGNLFRMQKDGANIHQIGKNTLFEGHPTLMPDGRILYDRWEYVDRDFGDAQGLWVVNPDGTQHGIYWGNNTPSPGAKIEGRILPNGLCLCIFGSCHDRPWGALTILDRSKGVDGRPPVVRTWPSEAIQAVGEGSFDTFKKFRPRYEDPYPLNEKYFLVSRSVGATEEMALALVDIFGNEIELHREAPGCFDPMPIAPRPKPPVIPVRRTYDGKPGKFYIQDVYVGTHMQGVKRGEVQFLRVVESGEKRSWINNPWTGQKGYAPGTQWPPVNWSDLGTKRILGTVPIEPDGSVYFECPSDTFVFFQLLDKNGRMIQTMRSGTTIQPGELQGCIGCHEDRVNQSAVNNNPAALQRSARKLDGWYGPAHFFSFTKDVQPIFDRHCVKCHDFGQPAGKKLLLCGDRALTFSASYKDLSYKGIANCPGTGTAAIPQPYSWGSNRSKLMEVLDKGHENVKLSPEEMDRLATWIDLNGPYYPTYDCAYPDHLTGRCPLDNNQLKRLGVLVSLDFNALTGYGANRGAQVSFDRPELSPCLAKLVKDSPEYREALAIIQAGQAQLKQKPEADRDGFVAADYAQKRESFSAERHQKEREIHQAIASGRKIYDQ